MARGRIRERNLQSFSGARRPMELDTMTARHDPDPDPLLERLETDPGRRLGPHLDSTESALE